MVQFGNFGTSVIVYVASYEQSWQRAEWRIAETVNLQIPRGTAGAKKYPFSQAQTPPIKMEKTFPFFSSSRFEAHASLVVWKRT